MQQNLDIFDDDPTSETLEDIHIGEKSLLNAVLYNTDWTVETLIRQVEKRSIDLNPSFQRRDAWSIIRKSQFIESIALNFPVPPLTLAERSNTKTFIIVDGKQRLTTLAQFFGLLTGSPRNNFKLRGLTELPQLNGLTAKEVSDSYPGMYMRIENYSIRTNIIRGWQKDEVLYSIFLRLNSGSVKLSPQELRQALHPGPFADFLLEYSENSAALKEIFPGDEPDFRMRDLELLVRYFGFQIHLEEYRGDLKQFLDLTVSKVNDEWPRVKVDILQIAERFERIHRIVSEVFGTEGAYRKWNVWGWEGRLNRAVFDVMTFFIRDSEQQDAFAQNAQHVIDAFRQLCEEDDEFRASIETTTKSIWAVGYRLSKWGEQLKKLGIIKSNVASLDYNRLEYDGQFKIF